jgi:hypothetical protein
METARVNPVKVRTVRVMMGTSMVTVKMKVLPSTIARSRGHPVQALAGRATRALTSHKSTLCTKPMSR